MSDDRGRSEWLADQARRTREVVPLVLEDLRRSGRAAPTIELLVDVELNAVYLAVNGSYEGPQYLDGDAERDKVVIADYIQSQLMDGPIVGSFWPECIVHKAGLHAEVRNAVATWWCRPGNHGFGAIGSLAD